VDADSGKRTGDETSYLNMKTRQDQKRKTIEELIRLVWFSLDTHLEWTHKKSPEGKRWHVKCSKIYLKELALLGELL
jgi:hypothetical protein